MKAYKATLEANNIKRLVKAAEGQKAAEARHNQYIEAVQSSIADLQTRLESL